MKNILLALTVLGFSSVASANFFQDLSELTCSAKKKAKVEAALFTTNPNDFAIYFGSERNPSLWYTINDTHHLQMLCGFHVPDDSDFFGLETSYICGYKTKSCDLEKMDTHGGNDNATGGGSTGGGSAGGGSAGSPGNF